MQLTTPSSTIKSTNPQNVVRWRQWKASQRDEVSSIVSPADFAELERHHRFSSEPAMLPVLAERMVHRYHEHHNIRLRARGLDAILRTNRPAIWRTQRKYNGGKEARDCGNKHCPVSPTTDYDRWGVRERRRYLPTWMKFDGTDQSERRTLLKN
jgi:hypothetical protein